MTSRLPEGFFNIVWFFLKTYYPWFISGVLVTLKIALIGTVVGLLLGLLITVSKQLLKAKRHDPWLKRFFKRCGIFLLNCYVEFFRGTPMMVQAMFIFYFVTNNIGFRWNPETAGIVVVFLNTAAYMAEILRAGIESVDPGQEEAARALGMTQVQAMTTIIIPQGIRNSLPAICNEFIVNVKDSSVLSVIAVTELFRRTNYIVGIYSRTSEAFFICCIIYLSITLTLSRVFKYLEKRMDMPPRDKGQVMPKHYKPELHQEHDV